MSKIERFFEETQQRLTELYAQKAHLESQLLNLEDSIKNIEATATGVRFGIQLKEDDGNDDNANEQGSEGSEAI
jgi:prefoldin subunit 5